MKPGDLVRYYSNVTFQTFLCVVLGRRDDVGRGDSVFYTVLSSNGRVKVFSSRYMTLI
jgi:hypothetical protein